MPDHQNLLFARLALERGYCTPAMIQAGLRELNELDARGQQIQLGQILVRRRSLTPQQFVEIAEALDESILRCPECQTTHHVLDFAEDQVYHCKRCGTELRPHSHLEQAVVDTRIDGPAAADTRPASPGGHDSQTMLYAGEEPPAPPAPPARRRIGPYQIVEQVGRGGMGVVYRARKEGEEREYALKVLLGGGDEDSERVQRFIREGNIVEGLLHENIVKTYEWGRDGEVYYFSMEFVEGTTLDKVVERHPLGQRRALQTIETVARALQHAHEKGIIHRDLKPGNVLVGHDGVVRIMDFGLARVMGDDDHSLTRTGQPMGTPYYMSPEQCRGEKRKVDHRSDVYSLGAVLYELICGRRPFSGRTTIDLYHKIQNDDPVPLRQHNPSIPKAVEEIVFKALEKDASLRYQSAGAMADDIQRVLSGQPIDSGTRTGVWRIRRRRKHWPVAIAVAAVASVVGGLAALLALRDGTPAVVDEGAAWKGERAQVEEAVREARFEDAAEHLAKMASAGAPEEELARVGELVRLGFNQYFTELVFADQLGQAAELLALAARLEFPAGAVENLRSLALDKSFERIRVRLEREEYRDTEKLIAAVREAFGDHPRLVEFERWAAGLCTFTLRTEPPGAGVSLQRVDRETMARIGAPQDLGPTPVDGAAVKFGSYEVRIEAQGRPLSFPVLLARGAGGRPLTAEFAIDMARIPSEMAYVPGGEFVYGPPEAERRIEIRDFLVDRHEVTCRQYAEFLASLVNEVARRRRMPSFDVDADPAERDRQWTGPAAPRGMEDVPVTQVSYEDMAAFAAWAGKRLPSREEWEKAARGIDKRPYPWGGKFDAALALLELSGAKAPQPAGSFAKGASPYGCEAMIGNVRERTSTPAGEGERYVKGGSYLTSTASARAFDEETEQDVVIAPDLGFRCVRSYAVRVGTEELLAALSDPLPGMRQEAARLLGEKEPSPEIARALLPAALDDADDAVRLVATASLAKHGDPATLEEILAAARTRKGDSRLAALGAAARLTPPERIGEVVAFLEDEDDGVRLHVETVLLERQLPEGVDPLRALFARTEKPFLVRAKAAVLLGSYGNAEGLAYLRESVNTQKGLERYLAAYSLWQLGDGASAIPLIEIHLNAEHSISAGNIVWFLAALVRDGTGLPAIREGLKHASPAVRAFCAKYLGEARDREALALLTETAAKDPSPEVRDASNKALERLR